MTPSDSSWQKRSGSRSQPKELVCVIPTPKQPVLARVEGFCRSLPVDQVVALRDRVVRCIGTAEQRVADERSLIRRNRALVADLDCLIASKLIVGVVAV